MILSTSDVPTPQTPLPSSPGLSRIFRAPPRGWGGGGVCWPDLLYECPLNDILENGEKMMKLTGGKAAEYCGGHHFFLVVSCHLCL